MGLDDVARDPSDLPEGSHEVTLSSDAGIERGIVFQTPTTFFFNRDQNPG